MFFSYLEEKEEEKDEVHTNENFMPTMKHSGDNLDLLGLKMSSCKRVFVSFDLPTGQ